MRELIEYALLPYNPDVRAPRGLKTFTSGLAELDLDKNLIRNKILLADLVSRQPEDDQDTDVSDSETESNNNETDESQEEHNREDQEDSESESEGEEEEEQECYVCQEPKSFFKISVAQCPNCCWHEAYHSPQNQLVVCDVCLNSFAINARNTKQMFYRCEDCDSMHTLSLKSNILKPLVLFQKPEEVDGEYYYY